MRLSKPTRIIAPPKKELFNGRWHIMLETDAGTMPLRHAAAAADISRTSLDYRLGTSSDAWQDPDVFSPERLHDGKWKKDSKKSNNDDAALIRLGRKDPEKLNVGTWERTVQRPELTERQIKQKRLAQKRRDQEYRDALKHHRAVCG